MRKIYIYENEGKCQIAEFFLKSNPKIQKKLEYQLEYIRDKHNGFTEPHVKHFTIEKYRRLYELRVKAAGTMVRVIFYDKDGEVLLLYAFYTVIESRGGSDTVPVISTFDFISFHSVCDNDDIFGFKSFQLVILIVIYI